MPVFLKKHWKLVVFFLIMIIVCCVSIFISVKFNGYFIGLYKNNDFHYNLITFNSVIAGFLFSGMSILVSLISNPSIKRLWDNGYLDDLYHSGGIGIGMSVVSIIMAFITVLKIIEIDSHIDFIRIWTIIEITFSLGSLLLFLYCVKELMFSIKLLRKKNNNNKYK